MINVIGHKNPDTDSICSAIGYAAFKTALTGKTYVPRRAGSLNPETQFVLEHFGLETPELLEDATGLDIILVDHNEFGQAVDNLAQGTIHEIIDHHKIGDVQTPNPIYFRNMPVGCTATIIYLHYKENDLKPGAPVAGALCSAILSDTLAFRSPTCTETDREAAAFYAEIAGIEDTEAYAKQMFKAGSELAGKSEKEIFYMDYKQFDVNGKIFGVGQVTSMDEDELKELCSTMKNYMDQTIQNQDEDMMFFMLTNILDESSELIYSGDGSQDVVQKAFDVDDANTGQVYLEGVVSRKKQIVPQITEALS